MNRLKKIIAGLMVMGLVAAVAPSAQAATAAELQAQIDTLLASLAGLQTQLATLQGTPAAGTPAVCSGITFTANLTVGSSGASVKCLQALLNKSADTQVAATGVGSAGSETTYFGNLTKAAVVKYQTKKAISPAAGFVGPLTRASLNTMLTTTTTVVPPVVPPITGITTPGAEGSMIATIESAPASGVVTYTSNTDKAVAAVRVKVTGSDVLINRLDVNFSTRPWLYLKKLTVTDGTTTKTVDITSSNSTEVTVGSSYDFRVEGLNILVPKNTEKVLTVKVDTASALPSGETTAKSIVLTFAANAIRAVDGASVQQYAPTSALATRTFTVDPGSTAALEITAHADNPTDRGILVSDTAVTAGVVLAKINVKAKNKDAILRTVEFLDSTASGTLDVAYLYDGDTLLSSTSTIAGSGAAVTASSTFSNVNLTIPKDTTKTLTLKADIKKAAGNYVVAGDTVASSTISLSPDALTFAGEDAVTYATATLSGSAVAPGIAYFFTKAPSLSLASASIVGLTGTTGSLSPQQAQATIRINVTANGGDIYVPIFSATAASSGLVASSGDDTVSSSTLIGTTISSNADYGDSNNTTWVIRSGTTKYLELATVLAQNGAGTLGHSDYAKIKQINWGPTVAAAEQGTDNTTANAQTWGLTNFKTSPIFLQALQ